MNEKAPNDLAAQDVAQAPYNASIGQDPTAPLPGPPGVFSLPPAENEPAQVTESTTSPDQGPSLALGPQEPGLMSGPVRVLTQQQEAMMMAAAMCDHPGPFDITTDVRKTIHEEPGQPKRVTFEATFQVRCPKCKLPMCFTDVPMPGPREAVTGPRSDALGLTLTVALKPGKEVFEHFMTTIGKGSGLPAIATQIEPEPAPEPIEGILRKGLRKVSQALNLQPGTRPLGPDGQAGNPN